MMYIYNYSGDADVSDIDAEEVIDLSSGERNNGNNENKIIINKVGMLMCRSYLKECLFN